MIVEGDKFGGIVKDARAVTNSTKALLKNEAVASARGIRREWGGKESCSHWW